MRRTMLHERERGRAAWRCAVRKRKARPDIGSTARTTSSLSSRTAVSPGHIPAPGAPPDRRIAPPHALCLGRCASPGTAKVDYRYGITVDRIRHWHPDMRCDGARGKRVRIRGIPEALTQVAALILVRWVLCRSERAGELSGHSRRKLRIAPKAWRLRDRQATSPARAPAAWSRRSSGGVPWELSPAGDRTRGRDPGATERGGGDGGGGGACLHSDSEHQDRELTGPHCTTSLQPRLSRKGRPVDAGRHLSKTGPSHPRQDQEAAARLRMHLRH